MLLFGYVRNLVLLVASYFRAERKAVNDSEPLEFADVDMTFPVELQIDETPVSLQARAESKANWKDRVRRAVDETLDPSGWATESPVAVTIFYFPDGPMIGDVDNIVKLILDGMKPRVYVDDAQVYRVVAQKFEPDEPSKFMNPTKSLAAAIDADRPMVYIRIDSRSTQELQ